MTIELSHVIEGALGIGNVAGAPTAGTNQVDTLTIDATGGTFTLIVGGLSTAAITWSGTNGTLLGNINTAVRALPNVGGTAITATAGTLTAGVGTILLTASGALGKKAMPGFFAPGVSSTLTGAKTLTIDSPSTTPGVDASSRSAALGSLLSDTTNGILYIATTANPPTWTKVGTQT